MPLRSAIQMSAAAFLYDYISTSRTAQQEMLTLVIQLEIWCLYAGVM